MCVYIYLYPYVATEYLPFSLDTVELLTKYCRYRFVTFLEVSIVSRSRSSGKKRSPDGIVSSSKGHARGFVLRPNHSCA